MAETASIESSDVKKTGKWSKIRQESLSLPKRDSSDDTPRLPDQWGALTHVTRFIVQMRRRSSVDPRALSEVDPFLEKLSLGDRSAASGLPNQHIFLDIFTRSFWKDFVVDEHKPFLFHWLAVVSVAVMYSVIAPIFRAVFYEEQTTLLIMWFSFDYTCDAIYLFDMFIESRTGFLEEGLVVRNKKVLAKQYAHSYAFILDIISIFPFEVLYSLLGTGAAYLRVNRCFKIFRLRRFFRQTETSTSFPNIMRISHLLVYLLLLMHWNACLFYALSRRIGFGRTEWTYPKLTPQYATLGHKYLFSFCRSVLLLTTIGDDHKPGCLEEYAFVIANSMVGVLIFATIFGNVGSMISNMNADRTEFQNKVDSVKQYMVIRKVGKELEHRVIRWFDYTWNNKQSVDDSQALSCLPDKLKAEIAINVHLNTLKRVAIFQDCEPGLLAELVLKLQLQVCSPGDYICKKGDIGKEMYIVKSGQLHVVSEDGKKVFVTLRGGAVFGEVSILNIAGNKTGNRRTASVRSVGYSDLFSLSKDALLDALREYPEAKKMLMERGKQILRKDNLLDEAAALRDEQKQLAMVYKIDAVLEAIEAIRFDLDDMNRKLRNTTAAISSRINMLEEKSGQHLLDPKSATENREDTSKKENEKSDAADSQKK